MPARHAPALALLALPALLALLVLRSLGPTPHASAADLPRALRKSVHTVRVLQGGRVVPVVQGRVLLRRAPFDLELTLPGPGQGALVNVSASPALSKRARTRKTLLDGPPLGPGSGMAEDRLNTKQELWLSASGSHYLYYQSATDHRFSAVRQVSGRVVGTRRVAALVDLDAKAPARPLGQWRGKDLYLVFLASSYGKAGAEEQWRYVLQLRFR